MELIETNNTKGFENYIRETKNMICGRHAINLISNIIQLIKTP